MSAETPSHRRRRRWSRGQEIAAGAAAAVVALAIALAATLLWDHSHPAGTPSASESPHSTGPPPTSGPQLVSAAGAALRSARTAHVTGEVGGPAGPVHVDLELAGGGNATGTVEVAGVPVQVVRSDNRTFVRSKQLVQRLAGSIAANIAGNHWLVVGPDQWGGTGIDHALDTVTKLSSLAGLVDAAAPTARETGPTTVDGHPAIRVTSGPTTLDIARGSPPYPLSVQAPGGVALHLSAFGAPVDVQPPTRGVIDLGGLPGIG